MTFLDRIFICIYKNKTITFQTVDHTYMSQSLSCLEMSSKGDYDKIYFDYTAPEHEWTSQYISIHPTAAHDVKNEQYDVAQAVRDNMQLGIDDQHLLEGKYKR